jgi:hypothetical protein
LEKRVLIRNERRREDQIVDLGTKSKEDVSKLTGQRDFAYANGADFSK